MKAMILAAGVGSRLRPMTDRLPKALVEVGGTSLLELVARRLVAAGATDIIVNVFHHADQVAAFVASRGRALGARFELSVETTLLDTGGGLKNASWFLEGREPFLVHNVDVVSEVDLQALMAAHSRFGALATLAVKSRPTKRLLAFDERGRLLGRASSVAHEASALAFSGIQALSPAIFSKMKEAGAFSLTDCYVRLAEAGEDIRAFRHDEAYWTDVGDADKLEAARRRALERGSPA